MVIAGQDKANVVTLPGYAACGATHQGAGLATEKTE